MVSRDPIRIVGGSRRHRRAVRGLTGGGGFALLRCAGWLLGELGALSRLALLREVRGDPNGVEEVANTTETGQEKEVKEETDHGVNLAFFIHSHMRNNYSHVRVEDAGLGLDDADSGVVGVDIEESSLSVRDNGRQSQSQVLRMHLIHETVAQLLLLASRYLDTVSRGS